jgi:hypothetical protein
MSLKSLVLETLCSIYEFGSLTLAHEHNNAVSLLLIAEYQKLHRELVERFSQQFYRFHYALMFLCLYMCLRAWMHVA